MRPPKSDCISRIRFRAAIAAINLRFISIPSFISRDFIVDPITF
nr:MAG TPA: hypothetical protein [Caudoviricetes sp.]